MSIRKARQDNVGRMQWRRREVGAAALVGLSFTFLDLQFKEKAPGYRFPRHAHAREFELYVVHRGGVTVGLGGGPPLSLRRREMVLIPPGMPHGAAGDPRRSVDVITVHFRAPGLLKRAPELVQVLGQPCTCDGALAEALGVLCAQGWRERPAPAWRLAAALGGFLALLADGPSAPPAGLAGPSRGLLGRLEERVHADPGRRLGLAAAADLLGCSLSQLTHARRRGGPRPHAVMLGARLDLAKRLLRETELPVKAIAQRVGFATQASFGRAFLRVERLTPGDYRLALVRAPGQVPA